MGYRRTRVKSPEDKCNKEEVCTQLQEILYTQVENKVQNDGVNSN